jgi:hypothetical protein
MSKEHDGNNNPIINPTNVRRGANHKAEGDTTESITSRVKVQLTVAEWKQLRRQSKMAQPFRLTQGKRYFWDITMCCIGSHSSWKRRKVK